MFQCPALIGFVIAMARVPGPRAAPAEGGRGWVLGGGGESPFGGTSTSSLGFGVRQPLPTPSRI